MKILENKTFKELTTFHIGGKIKYYAEVGSEREICEALYFADKEKLPVFILGGGSDFLASDRDFNGLVIKYTGKKYSIKGETVTAEGGMLWDDLVGAAVLAGLSGMECLSGIPGTVGASPVQNIGAYGQELKDIFVKLKAFSIGDGRFVEFNREDCRFGYRESVFKDKKYWQKYLITEVTFRLNRERKNENIYESLKGEIGSDPTLSEIRDAVLKVRAQKLENPAEFGNAGSFFKNPIISRDQKECLEKVFPDAKIYPFENGFKVSAGWLIENAGLKGAVWGGAAVSSKHALIIINKTGSATSGDVVSLSEMIIKNVFDKFGIKLEREVQFVNFD